MLSPYADGQKKESTKWLREYKKNNENDSRVNRFLKGGNLASVVFNSRQRYNVEPVDFNTEKSEFGVYVKGGDLYFASARPDDKNVNDTYGWNNEPWLDIFVVQTKKSTRRYK